MDTYNHICSGCDRNFVTGSPSLPPPGWRYAASKLLCDECDIAQVAGAPAPVEGGKPTPIRSTGKIEHGILLRSGVLLDLADPDYARVHIRDIAAGLTRTCRFNGQIDGWWPVAAHCVVGADIAPPWAAYAMLMHDGVEAVLGYVISPLKAMLPDYRRIEATHETRFFAQFGVSMRECHAEVKRIDRIMLAAENIAIRHQRTNIALAGLPKKDVGAAKVAAAMIAGSIVGDWEIAFLDRFYKLAPMEILAAHRPKQELAA